MAGIKCCRNCTQRYVGCHGECETYIKEKERWEKEKEVIKENEPVIIKQKDFEMLACMHRNRKYKK